MRSSAGKFSVLVVVCMLFVSAAAALDINSSGPVQYYNDDTLQFEVGTDGTLNLKGNVTLDGNTGLTGGNLGVGTDNPTADLDVNSNLRIRGLTNCDSIDTDGNGNLVCGTDATGSETTGGGWNDTDAGIVELVTDTDDVNATSLYVDNTNNEVGVGTNSPSTDLDVDSSLRVRGLTNCDSIDTDGQGNLVCGTDDTGTQTDGSRFLELDGTDSMNGSLDLGSNDLVDGGTVIWDTSNSYIPQTRLENEQVTVAGNSVSLGGSTGVAHADLSSIGADDHHPQILTKNSGTNIIDGPDVMNFTNALSVTNPSGSNIDIAVTSNSIDDAEIVDNGLDDTSLAADSVTSSELATNAVTAGNEALDSSVAGSGLTYNSGVLDVDSVNGFDGSEFLELDGTDSMNGSLDMGQNRIIDLPAPSASNDAVRKAYVDSTFLARDGTDSMGGDLDMAGNDIVNIGNMTLNGHAGITGGFNLGVGTSNPSSKLDVSGTVDATGFTEGGSNTLSNDISGDADTVDGEHASAFEEEAHADEHAGSGLSNPSGDTLDVNTGNALTISSDSVVVAGNSINDDEVADNSLSDSSIASGAITASGTELDSSVAGSGVGYSSGALDVNTGTGLTVSSDQVQVNSNVPLKNQMESISAAMWTFENNLTVRGNLDVFGNITNTDVNNLNVNGSLLPPAQYDNQFDLGSGSRRWRDVYVAQNLYDASGNNFFETGNLGAGQRISGISSDGGISTATIDHDNLNGVSSGDHHTRPSAGTLLSESSNQFNVNESGISHDAIDQSTVTYNDHHGVGTGLSWDENDDVAVGANALDSAHIGGNAITQSGGELDNSVAGEGLTYNSGALDVDQGDGSGMNADTVDGKHASAFLELDGTDSMNGSLDLGSNDLVDGGTVVWDQSAGYVPQGRLENEQVTVAGNSVSLGGSTGVAHADLSSIGADDHHPQIDAQDSGTSVVDGPNAMDFRNALSVSTDGSGVDIAVSEGSIDHGNLAGLGDGDHPSYLELDGSDSMNGTLDLGGNNVALNGGWLSNDGNNEGVTVDNSGQVGIGTSPSSALDVSGTADASGFTEGGSNTLSNDISGDADTVDGSHASDFRQESDVWWGVVSLETGDFETSDGNSGSVNVPTGSDNKTCDSQNLSCIKTSGSTSNGQWAIEFETPTIGMDESDYPGSWACHGISAGDNEQDNENWGAGVRSTITDSNGHCLTGGNQDMAECAASYVYDANTGSHDTYGIVCEKLN